MKLLPSVLAVPATLGIALLLCGFANSDRQGKAVGIIVTAAPSYDATAGLRGEERFANGAQLLLIRGAHAEPLVEGFAASADANVSFDGGKILFAGKRSAKDSWAIWELEMADRSVRKVIGGDSDLVRPIYLPGDWLVYARHTASGYRLETAQHDGTATLPLSYIPGNALPLDPLADGRILFESTFPLGTGTTPEMYLVYSDGSGVESYRCDHGTARWGGRQLQSGDVIFTHGDRLGRFTSPLAAEEKINAPEARYAGRVVETASGDWLLSAREREESRFSLKSWKPGTSFLVTVYAQRGQNLIDPVLLTTRMRPNRHPSGLHDWQYGNLLALDARESREGNLNSSPAAVRVEMQDGNSRTISMGTAPVEPDGSFFVKVPADKPIRFALLGAKGTVLRREQGWFWIRKGEQRICVGCHTGPELASENRVPQVLLRSTTPVDLFETPKDPPVAGSH